MRHPVRVPDLTKKLRDVMSKERFQTAFLLNMQIVFPPEVVTRLKLADSNRSTVSLITSILIRRTRAGEFVRRKNEHGIYEYKANSDFVLDDSQRDKRGHFAKKKEV